MIAQHDGIAVLPTADVDGHQPVEAPARFDVLRFTRALLAAADPAAMVRKIGEELRARVVLFDHRRQILAAYPAVMRVDRTPPQTAAEAPVTAGERILGWLRIEDVAIPGELLDLCAGVIATALSRDHADHDDERAIHGRAIAAIIGGGDLRSASTVLTEAGIDFDSPIYLVLALQRRSAAAPTWNCPEGPDCCVSAIVDDRAVVLLQRAADVRRHAEGLLCASSSDRAAGCVGIGGPARGTTGLRIAFAEASSAAKAGCGINESRPLEVSELLAMHLDQTLTEQAERLLEPLMHFDRKRGAELMATLRVLLEEDFSLVRTAKRLFVHQNTVKYRIAQISELVGVDCATLRDRVQLWVAVQALAGSTAH
ncbi:PucR family transcriptional regulator [Ruicaihuangia caeni]|uniref:PucR family transcriptional regulator n=1 Tax=Ruicaihuangia caeni TaxID=3042517 RepID=UPI00338D82DC